MTFPQFDFAPLPRRRITDVELADKLELGEVSLPVYAFAKAHTRALNLLEPDDDTSDRVYELSWTPKFSKQP